MNPEDFQPTCGRRARPTCLHAGRLTLTRTGCTLLLLHTASKQHSELSVTHNSPQSPAPLQSRRWWRWCTCSRTGSWRYYSCPNLQLWRNVHRWLSGIIPCLFQVIIWAQLHHLPLTSDRLPHACGATEHLGTVAATRNMSHYLRILQVWVLGRAGNVYHCSACWHSIALNQLQLGLMGTSMVLQVFGHEAKHWKNLNSDLMMTLR